MFAPLKRLSYWRSQISIFVPFCSQIWICQQVKRLLWRNTDYNLAHWPCAIVPVDDSTSCNVPVLPLTSVIKTVETVTLEIANGSKSMRQICCSIQSPIIKALQVNHPQKASFVLQSKNWKLAWLLQWFWGIFGYKIGSTLSFIVFCPRPKSKMTPVQKRKK